MNSSLSSPYTWLVLIALIFTLAASCRRAGGSSIDEALKSSVETALPKGTPRKDVEKFLKSNGLQFAFNELDSRYEARPSNAKIESILVESDVSLRIYISPKLSLVERIEVVRLATGF